jgi:serine/threonine protein kinase
LLSLENKPKKWTLNDFEIGKPLGRGKFGDVYLARERRSKFIVALKVGVDTFMPSMSCSHLHLTYIAYYGRQITQVIKKSQLVAAGVEYQLRREIEIQANLRYTSNFTALLPALSCFKRTFPRFRRHKNILRMYGYFWDEKRIYIILEFAPGGELYRQMTSRGQFSETVTARYGAASVWTQRHSLMRPAVSFLTFFPGLLSYPLSRSLADTFMTWRSPWTTATPST